MQPPSASPPPPLAPAPPPQARKRSRWLLFGCGGLLAVLVIIFATVAITIWWIQRPIKPVVLSASEKSAVEEKLQHLGGRDTRSVNRAATAGDSVPVFPDAAPKVELDRQYVPGSKVFKLTERELNGLLNANTDLGKTVRLEFGRDAINAYVAVPIPQDFPVVGGRMFRARARFKVSLGDGGAPYAIIEDVSVLGISLPKAWLAGLKGENLLGQATGGRDGSPVIKGIKSLRVEPGALVLEVAD